MFHKLPKLDWFSGSQGLQIKKKNFTTLHNRTRGLYGHFNKVVWGHFLNFYFYLKKKINWDIIFFLLFGGLWYPHHKNPKPGAMRGFTSGEPYRSSS